MKHRAKALLASLQVEQQELGSMISCVHDETRCTGSCEVLRIELADLETAYEGVVSAIESITNFIGDSNGN